MVVAATAQLLLAEQPGPAPGVGVATATVRTAQSDAIQAVATVEAVDAVDRTVILKGPRGYLQRLGVSDEVRNLAQVKAGDRVVVTYAQALALQLKKGAAGIRERVERDGGKRIAPGERPAGAGGREVMLVADVVAVNYNRQTVTLRGPQQTVTLAVPDGVHLRSITTGDQVHATYTEAFALAVKAAPRTAGGE